MTLVALVSITLVLFLISIKTTTLTQAKCLPDQRDALILLKQGFNTTKLHSWNANTECCIWDGIRCDEQTGMVTMLDLADWYISGEINLALFNLSSLRYLNLSSNEFTNIILPPTGFERLANLTHLDLSDNWFSGQIPISISALTNLISLDLSDYYGQNSLYLHDTGLKTLLSNLTKLQLLHLDGVDISLNGSEWANAVFQVGPTLQKLSLVACGLGGNLPDEIFHLTNLTELDLSYNSMSSGQLSYSIENLQYLSTLGLIYCNLYGEIPPSITNLTRLEVLNLGSNMLTGTIPMSLFSHPSLKYLGLFYNQLSGYLPEFSNGSSILEIIHLYNNNLQGRLPISIFKSPQLIELDINPNNFSGTFNLDVIKHNKNLESLDLSNNKLSIIEGKNHNESFYTSFPQMTDIWLASCNLKKFPSFLSYQINISSLDLSNNKINGVIPNWLYSKISTSYYLNLSHNFFTKIEGDAPFMSLQYLNVLDIHSNMIVEPVPLLPPNISFMDFSFNYFFLLPSHFAPKLFYLSLSNNNLTEEIPLSICNATYYLQVLNLSYNNLFGIVPPCLLQGGNALAVLDLKSNKLSGTLSQDISQPCGLRTINLNGNGINGSLPELLMNCNALEVLDLGNNQIVNRFPYWLGNLENLRVLVLTSNQFYGNISDMEIKTKRNDIYFPMLQILDISSNHFNGALPKNIFVNLKAMMSKSNTSSLTISYESGADYYKNSVTVTYKGLSFNLENTLGIFISLDLSNNEFWGEIPEEIGQLKSLHVINLSHNVLTSPIPLEFSNLEQLESLDLSSNQLYGSIPQELTSLTFLASLNLSYNNLVGEIPEARQFSTFSNASYMGNPELCGSPLSMQCAAAPSNHRLNKSLPSKSSTDIIGLSVSIGVGLGVGFVSVIWATISWENGRKWFNFVIDRFYFRHFH